MTAEQMLNELGYKKVSEEKSIIKFENHSHGDGDYSYVIIYPIIKAYVVGYFDGYMSKEFMPYRVDMDLHKAVTKLLEESGCL